MKLRTIKSKLLLVIAVILLLPGMVIGYFSYQSAKEQVRDELIQSAGENVKLLNNLVNTFIVPKQNQTELLSVLLSKEMDQPTSEQSIHALLEKYMKTNPETLNSYVGTNEGNMIISPKQQLPADYDPRKRPWYEAAVANKGKTIVTAPYADSATGKPVITVARVLENGQGVVGLDLSMETISTIVNGVKIGHEGYPFIQDQNRKMVVHPTLEVGALLEEDFINKVYESEEGHFNYVFNDVEKEMVFTTNELTGWKIGGTLNSSEVEESARPILIMTTIVIVISSIVGALLAFPIINPIIRSLRKLVYLAEKISEGDLTERVDIRSNDELGELGQSFNKMSENLRSILANVNQTSTLLTESAETLHGVATQTNEATQQVNEAIQEVASGSEIQVQSSHESARAMEEMALGIQRIAESSSDVSEASTEATELAEEGSKNLHKVIEQMTVIHTSVGQTHQIVTHLGKRSNEIGQILEVITGISEQTNLLALNAAIEAARAGENGRGFAVVADEVRKLAEESRKSAEQISVMIREIQDETQKAVIAMEQGRKEADSGAMLAMITEENFENILKSIQRVAFQIQEVSSASQEMSAGAEEVSASFEQMATIAQDSSSKTKEVANASEQQTAAVEEIISSAGKLAEFAADLKEEIRKFKI